MAIHSSWVILDLVKYVDLNVLGGEIIGHIPSQHWPVRIMAAMCHFLPARMPCLPKLSDHGPGKMGHRHFSRESEQVNMR